MKNPHPGVRDVTPDVARTPARQHLWQLTLTIGKYRRAPTLLQTFGEDQ